MVYVFCNSIISQTERRFLYSVTKKRIYTAFGVSQTPMITKRQKEMSLGKCALHVLLQLIPVIDIIDLVYVTNKYWKRGKVLAILTAVFACILVILGLVNKVIM